MSDSQQTAEELMQLAAALRRGVRVKDRRYLFRSYPCCFVGQEAVAWLVSAGHAATPAEAVRLGNHLMEMGIFHHVLYEHMFEDDYLFYRFTDDGAASRPPVGVNSATQLSATTDVTQSAAQLQQQQSRDGRMRLSELTNAALGGVIERPPDSLRPESAQLGSRRAGQPPPGRTTEGAPLPLAASSGNDAGGSGTAAAAAASADSGATAAACSGQQQQQQRGSCVEAGLSLAAEPRPGDRMRWQVIAGHLQQLQGRVTHMQQAAEAQRAIADIMVSEVNELRGQVSELCGRLDVAAAAIQSGYAATSQLTQQIAGLRLLCMGLCACILQQAVLSWLRPSGGGGGGTGGGGEGGVFMSGSGSCWGVALAVTVALLGLTVLLPPRLAARDDGGAAPAAAAAGTSSFSGRGSGYDAAAKLLPGDVPAGGEDGDGAVAAAAAESTNGPRKSSFGDSSLRRSFANSSGSFPRGGSSGAGSRGAGGEDLLVLRRCVTGDPRDGVGGAAGTASFARRSVEAVRLLTAPMRLHLPLAARQQAVVRRRTTEADFCARRAEADDEVSAAAAAVAAAAPASGPKARSLGGDGTAAATTAASSCKSDTGASDRMLAVDYGGEEGAVTAAALAASQSMPTKASSAAAALPPSTAVPSISDFADWPDAPVLLAFHTGLVPEHALSEGAAAAAAAAGGDVDVGGKPAASEVSGTIAGLDIQASTNVSASPWLYGSNNSSTGDGVKPAPADHEAPAAPSRTPIPAATAAAAPSCASETPLRVPAPTTPGLMRLRANGKAPIRIETELFSGQLAVFLRGLEGSQEALFGGKKRMSWVAMQGRFKKPLSLNAVVTGQEFSRSFKRLPAAWFVERVLLSMAKQISPSMRVGPLSAPSLMMPLISSAQMVNVSRPGLQPPMMDCKEDVRLFCPRLAARGQGASAAEQPAAADVRRKHFSAPRNRAGLVYDTENVWTFHFWQQFVDLVSYKLDFGYTYDLVQHLDGQPLQVMAKDLDSGRYLYNVLIWNERLVAAAAGPGRSVTDASGVAAIGGPDDDFGVPGTPAEAASYGGRGINVIRAVS